METLFNKIEKRLEFSRGEVQPEPNHPNTKENSCPQTDTRELWTTTKFVTIIADYYYFVNPVRSSPPLGPFGARRARARLLTGSIPMDPQPINEELTIEGHLRPKIWADYIGQDAVKRNLRVILDAAKKRGESPDHLLFYGQAGLGKTTLAYLVANELGARLRVTSGPALEKMGDIAAILSNLEPHDILFIDEIHRLNRLIEEVLYPAMEMRKLHMIIGKGPAARTLSLDLPPFTLIAATTKTHLLSAPLRSRFGATFKLDYYEIKDIEQIVKKSAQVLNLSITPGAVKMLSWAARFTPRVANRLLKRARDYIAVFNFSEINEEAARKTLEMLEIDELGLEQQDRRLLQVIVEKFSGGPVGINTIAAAMSDDPATIEDVYEPYLMRLSFLQRTSSGRVVTLEGSKHINLFPKGRL